MNIDENDKIITAMTEKNKLDENDVNMLLQLSQSREPEIRAYTAELLVKANDDKAEKILIDMCEDEDELVRVNACDSLCAFASAETYERLAKSFLTDRSLLVKRYALLSIIDIMNDIKIDREKLKSFFISNVNTEDLGICAACFKGLYLMGEEKYLDRLLNLTKSENYQDRCMVLNILEDIITEKNKECILSAVKELRKAESSNAVNSIIDRIMMENL